MTEQHDDPNPEENRRDEPDQSASDGGSPGWHEADRPAEPQAEPQVEQTAEPEPAPSTPSTEAQPEAAQVAEPAQSAPAEPGQSQPAEPAQPPQQQGQAPLPAWPGQVQWPQAPNWQGRPDSPAPQQGLPPVPNAWPPQPWPTPGGPGAQQPWAAPAQWPAPQPPTYQPPAPQQPPFAQTPFGQPPSPQPPYGPPPYAQPGSAPQPPFAQPQQPWPYQPGWQPPAGSPGQPFGYEAYYGSANRRFKVSRRSLQTFLGIFAAVLIAFSSGMVVDRLTAPSNAVPLNGFSKYAEALQVIRQYYVGRNSLNDQQLVDGSIAGLVQALGDTNHSRYLTKDEYDQMTSQLSGHLVGIGVLLTTTADGQFQVSRVLPNSPAQAGGIKTGDIITAVDGKSVNGFTFDQLATLIRGDAGTSVTVSVIHEGSTTPVDVKMVRQTVNAPLVDWGMIPGTTIADIALYEFSQGAGDQVEQAITGAEQKGATGLILDLRGNPGGLADEARHVASEFLSTGNIYIVEDANGRKTPISVDRSVKSTELPMVVLVDHDTASAAEIVAGALQDAGRAKIVGLTTIGTGTVLEPFPLSDGSVILLGIEDWLTPNGHRIFGVGITPDQVVSLPTGGQPTDPYDFTSMTSSQIQSSSDAQLLAAIKDLSQ